MVVATLVFESLFILRATRADPTGELWRKCTVPTGKVTIPENSIKAFTAFSPFWIFVQHGLKIGLDGDIAFGPTFSL